MRLRQYSGQTTAIKGVREYTYEQLQQRIDALAAALVAHNVRHGDRVALLLRDRAELLACFLAANHIGAIAMPFYEWPMQRLTEMVRITKPALCFADRPLADVTCLHPGDVAEGRVHTAPPKDEDLFYIGFTSGTTGTPKGFMRTWNSWKQSFRLSDAMIDWARVQTVLIPGPLESSLFLYGALHALYRGKTVQLLSPEQLTNRSVYSADAVLYAVPSMLARLPEKIRLAAIICGGDRCPDSLRKALCSKTDAEFIEFYGSSEASFIAAHSMRNGRDGSVGRVLPGVECRIVDEAGNILPNGEVGLLQITSPLLFSGYVAVGRSDLRTFTTEDYGYLDDDGYLFLTGRKEDKIICRGVKMYPREIEAIALAFPGITEAAAIGVPHDRYGQEAVLVLLEAECTPEIKSALRKQLRMSLTHGQYVRRIITVNDFPRTENGKLSRTALREALHA
ncbi:class I adenylate-forming enzyme family protein [Aneurinibacillus sp. UBA3580]|jgi:long-chain acyl-CoA synthetase|uniref:class I adenylate-forming enzyme family protein n=1 Tax=Aneurinibacillus sp. UBA3580 TaxID=1946041 RepID=UPI0025797F4B|nr:class I adenylate-forming enzyme family protein [Aneurinibacillus sp. UBA3580]